MVISFFMLAILVGVFILIFNIHHYGYWYPISTTIINNLNILRCSAYSGDELQSLGVPKTTLISDLNCKFGGLQGHPHFWRDLQDWGSQDHLHIW